MITGMRTRPGYLVALGLVVAGGTAYATVPPRLAERDRAAAARSERIALALRDPADATVRGPNECHGDGIERCIRIARPVRAVADEYAAALRAAGTHEPAVRCETYAPLRAQAGFTVDECDVRATTGGDHAVMVLLRSELRRDAHDVRHFVGTTVDVTSY